MAGPNMDQFEAFFRKADLDGDGRISGAEAVAFFQGSNLPKPVLAQIWMHADQRKTGFLGRAEFYNALRLVTVAQSKRDLTPDIIKAALYSPTAAKIPAPQINLQPTPVPQPSPASAAPQNFGFGGPGNANPSVGQNYYPQQNPSVRPPQAVMPSPGMGTNPNVMNSNIGNNWIGGMMGSAPSGPRGIGPSVPSPVLRPQGQVSTPLQPAVSATKALVVPGNGVSSDSSFGGDFLSATPSLPKSSSASLAVVPISVGPQPSNNNNSSINLLQDGFSMQPRAGQFQQPRATLNLSQQTPAPASSTLAPSDVSVGLGTSTPGNSQIPWPKMKPSDVQKYTKVFMEVDSDRDGRITGEEARNLFLSWRLPREVLKQVWDLSDQDNDSMLSLREFCFALYLMERFRENRPLPAALPHNVMFDETLLSMTGQPRVNNAAWSPSPGTGFGQHPGIQGAQPIAPTVNVRPPIPTTVPKPEGVQSNQQSSKAPVLDDPFLELRDSGNQNSTFSKSQEPTATRLKVEETKTVILDSKEKLELYRTKMQELVLYKSRCDNKLNEITERASADKREAESLGKKYEERYKQVAEIASKLTIEEATFRDIQERKMELNQAIIKMDQGGSVDGILQVRADRIQYELEELVKALNERCKKHGLQIKSSAMIELPNGWEPGIQDGAAVWDEEWDKFEDEGFSSDLTIDVKNISSRSTPQSTSVQRDTASPDGTLESESVFAHNEDENTRSPNDSPAGRTAMGSPAQAFSEVHSEADAETHRYGGGSFDDSTWSAFDNNDDVDSVWGFSAQKSNDMDSEKNRDFFSSDSFSVDPVRTGSPNAFQRKSPFSFDDSVPSTPASKFGNNSPRYSDAGDHYFDNFSSFDSFSTHDGGFSSSQPERLTRFDSMNSSKDFGNNTFSRFDSINSSRDFGNNPTFSRFDSINSSSDFGHGSFTKFDNSSRDFSHNPERLTRFDSINSSKDFGGGFGFDDSDPFGSSGPFKVSSEGQTSKKSTDNWNAF